MKDYSKKSDVEDFKASLNRGDLLKSKGFTQALLNFNKTNQYTTAQHNNDFKTQE